MIKPQYQELALKLSAKKMMAYGYNALRQIPKSEKHVIGADVRAAMHSLMWHIIECEKAYYKSTTLRNLDVSLENLRVLVGVLKELQFIDLHPYEIWSELLHELGNQVGGWILWYKDQESKRSKSN